MINAALELKKNDAKFAEFCDIIDRHWHINDETMYLYPIYFFLASLDILVTTKEHNYNYIKIGECKLETEDGIQDNLIECKEYYGKENADGFLSIDCGMEYSFDKVVDELCLIAIKINANTMHDLFGSFDFEDFDYDLSLGYFMSYILSLDAAWYSKYGENAYEYMMSKLVIYRSAKNKTKIKYLPESITSLCAKLIDISYGDVCIPHSELGGLGLSIMEDAKHSQSLDVTSYSENRYDYILEGLRALFHDYTEDGFFSCCGQIEDCQYDYKFDIDYLLSMPPFGKKVTFNDGSIAWSQDVFLKSIAYDCKCKGLGIFPASICVRGGDYITTLRKAIVEDDLLDTVILLPNNIIASVNIQTVIIITNRNKEKRGYVRFMDASKYYTSNTKWNTVEVDKICSALKDCNTIGSVKYVPNDIIVNSNYNLYPPYYVYSDIIVPDDMHLISLGDVLTRMPAVNATGNKLYAYIDTKAIRDSYVGVLDTSTMSEKNVKSSDLVLNEDCFVRMSNTFAYVKCEKCEAAVPESAVVYKVDANIVYPEYLLTEVNKTYFKKQLSRFFSGTAFGKINESDFLSCKLLLPKDQMRQVTAAIESQTEVIKQRGISLDALNDARYDDFVRNQRQRKHAVAQVLNEVVPSLDNIIAFIMENDNVSKDSVISKRFGSTLGQKLSLLQEKVEKVVQMVDSFTASEQFGDPEEIDIYCFLKEYCHSRMDTESYTTSCSKIRSRNKHLKVRISKKDLTQMLDNLFTNASKHGFKDPCRSDYEIKLSAELDMSQEPMVVIRIANNGELVSKTIPLERLFVWGEGHGSGIGCWQVKEIAEHYGGSVCYNEYPDDMEGFVCEFRIVLPLIEE